MCSNLIMRSRESTSCAFASLVTAPRLCRERALRLWSQRLCFRASRHKFVKEALACLAESCTQEELDEVSGGQREPHHVPPRPKGGGGCSCTRSGVHQEACNRPASALNVAIVRRFG